MKHSSQPHPAGEALGLGVVAAGGALKAGRKPAVVTGCGSVQEALGMDLPHGPFLHLRADDAGENRVSRVAA